jgi:hypothetical protein
MQTPILLTSDNIAQPTTVQSSPTTLPFTPYFFSMDQTNNCNIDINPFQTSVKTLFDKYNNAIVDRSSISTVRDGTFKLLMSDDYYKSVENLVKILASFDSDKMMCLSGLNTQTCGMLPLNLLYSNDELDNIISILTKYQPLILSMYNKLSSYSYDTLQKCGQDPIKAIKMKKILTIMGDMLSPQIPPPKTTNYYMISTGILCIVIIILLIVCVMFAMSK